MLDELLLLSGNDIPFYSANLVVHQPTIKEIAFIGEENFFMASQLLNFSKDSLSEEDRTNLADIDDFDILMAIINDENASAKPKILITLFFALLFPDFEIEFQADSILLFKEEEQFKLDSSNYTEFKEILISMFDLKPAEGEIQYNPQDQRAKEIAEKLKKGREKAAEAKRKARGEDTDKIAVFSRYLSILAVGMSMDMNMLLNYTVFQLQDQFKRFQKYQNFDINLRARMAGASDLDEVENWMEDIHL